MYLPMVEALNLVITPEASRLLTRTSRILAEKCIQSYIVGGFVRDAILGRPTEDIDIAVRANGPDVAEMVADTLEGRYVLLDSENGMGRVVFQDAVLDFATLQGDIEEDLARRDFTINAMAIELDRITDMVIDINDIIDPFQGQKDLEKGIIRTVSDSAFTDDAVRLLRGIRMAAELKFTIDNHTEELIIAESQGISQVAGERIREELLKLLYLPNAGDWIRYLDKTGLLTVLIPELKQARGVDQPHIHVWDVLDHSLETIKAVEFILRENKVNFAGAEVLAAVPWTEELQEHFNQVIGSGSTRRSLLKLAALLHDIAKPQTKEIDETGRARFLGHPQEGADMAASIMERLRFSTREIKLVTLLVKYHLRPTQMTHEGLPSTRAIYRYFRDTGDTGIDILFLSLADHLATRGPELDLAPWREHCRMVRYVLQKHAERESLSPMTKLLDGHDIINLFKLSPGPQVGKLLEAIKEAQATGEINSRQEAVNLVKKTLDEESYNQSGEETRGEA
jgi:poly(A) polymerase